MKGTQLILSDNKGTNGPQPKTPAAPLGLHVYGSAATSCNLCLRGSGLLGDSSTCCQQPSLPGPCEVTLKCIAESEWAEWQVGPPLAIFPGHQNLRNAASLLGSCFYMLEPTHCTS